MILLITVNNELASLIAELCLLTTKVVISMVVSQTDIKMSINCIYKQVLVTYGFVNFDDWSPKSFRRH